MQHAAVIFQLQLLRQDFGKLPQQVRDGDFSDGSLSKLHSEAFNTGIDTTQNKITKNLGIYYTIINKYGVSPFIFCEANRLSGDENYKFDQINILDNFFNNDSSFVKTIFGFSSLQDLQSFEMYNEIARARSFSDQEKSELISLGKKINSVFAQKQQSAQNNTLPQLSPVITPRDEDSTPQVPFSQVFGSAATSGPPSTALPSDIAFSRRLADGQLDRNALFTSPPEPTHPEPTHADTDWIIQPAGPRYRLGAPIEVIGYSCFPIYKAKTNTEEISGFYKPQNLDEPDFYTLMLPYNHNISITTGEGYRNNEEKILQSIKNVMISIMLVTHQKSENNINLSGFLQDLMQYSSDIDSNGQSSISFSDQQRQYAVKCMEEAEWVGIYSAESGNFSEEHGDYLWHPCPFEKFMIDEDLISKVQKRSQEQTDLRKMEMELAPFQDLAVSVLRHRPQKFSESTQFKRRNSQDGNMPFSPNKSFYGSPRRPSLDQGSTAYQAMAYGGDDLQAASGDHIITTPPRQKGSFAETAPAQSRTRQTPKSPFKEGGLTLTKHNPPPPQTRRFVNVFSQKLFGDNQASTETARDSTPPASMRTTSHSSKLRAATTERW